MSGQKVRKIGFECQRASGAHPAKYRPSCFLLQLYDSATRRAPWRIKDLYSWTKSKSQSHGVRSCFAECNSRISRLRLVKYVCRRHNADALGIDIEHHITDFEVFGEQFG